MIRFVAAIIAAILFFCNSVIAQTGPGGRPTIGPQTSGVSSTFPSSFGFGLTVSGATVLAAGTGYVPGDTYTPTLAGAVVNSILGGNYAGAIFYIGSTQVVSATPGAAGTGCTNGTYTITGTTGTGTGSQFFQASITVTSNVVQPGITITRAGVYQVNPTSLTSEPVSGVTGCAGGNAPTLNVKMGVLYVYPQNAGSYSFIPSNPMTATQSATSGIGTGATLTVNFSSFIQPPSNSNNGTAGSQAAFNYACPGSYLALNSVTSGVELTACGWNALGANTSGGFNTAFGVNALGNNNTTASNSVAFGRDAGRNANGSRNTFIGDGAGIGAASIATGPDNVAVGNAALSKATTAQQTVIIGSLAGFQLTSGQNHVFIGYNAGNAMTTDNNAVAIGNSAMALATTGPGVAIGFQALSAVTSGSGETAVGFQAGQKITGNNNTILGYQALGSASATSANNNTVIGYQSGNAITTGGFNTLLGRSVGSATLATGSRNILIGTASNCDTVGSGDNDTFQICASTLTTPLMSGSLVAASMTLTINPVTINMPNLASVGAAQTGTVCWSSTGGLLTVDQAAACLVSSERFKQDIMPIEDALSKVMAVHPITFRYRDQSLSPGTHLGFTAENVAEVEPHLVLNDEHGLPLKIRLQEMPALAFGAIQELERRLEAIEHRMR